MLRFWIAAVLLLVVVVAVVLAVALRDNQARPAVGERKIAQSGDAEVHYFVSGQRTATPVVLLPSYARSISDCNELVVELNNAGFRSIAIQPRGVDGSSLPSMSTTFHTYASDVAAVLAAENIQTSVSIIGHAYGNRTARTFATDYPQRSHQLILLAAGGETPTPPEVSSAIMKAMFGIFPESQRREAVAFAFFARDSVVPEYWMRGWYPMAGLAQGSATAASTTDKTNPAWASGGNDQIVILQPAEDAAAELGAASLLERFPDRVRVHRIEGAGHAILPEQPELVTQLILAALQQAQL
ncbi:MAG: alpha/beta fold hydrolase [Pseudomonadales bacterium]